MNSQVLPAPEVPVEPPAHALSPEQIEQFLREGHVILRRCFEREDAAPLVEEAWRLMGYQEDDPSTWEQPLRFLFPSTKVPIRDFSPKLWAALCELAGGEKNLSDPNAGIGQWVVNLGRGRDEEWVAPGPDVSGWHIDGNWFRHFLDSPEQGLLVVPIFSDIAHRGGGTIFAADSIGIVSKYLQKFPQGLLPSEVPSRELVSQCHDFRELLGEVGDVAIFHPLMLHSFAQNHSGKPRFITNICLSFKEPKRLDRLNQSSPVEQAILRGLGVEQLDFQIQGEREKVSPKSAS